MKGKKLLFIVISMIAVFVIVFGCKKSDPAAPDEPQPTATSTIDEGTATQTETFTVTDTPTETPTTACPNPALIGTVCDGPDSDDCPEGVYYCNNGVLMCSDNTGDNIDVCNGLDDDCDPATADGSAELNYGAPCDGSDGDNCNEGVYVCNGSALVCNDSTGTNTESCNMIDDDCDGDVDEDFPMVGQPCVVGMGACQNTGVFECNASGDGVQCSVFPGIETEEVCDGVDNDCNGVVDDNLTPPLCEVQTGVCSGSRKSVSLCQAGYWNACTSTDYSDNDGAYQTSETACSDGKDNDCDGAVDGADSDCAP